MKNLLLKVKLENFEPVTWGSDDAKKRKQLRNLLKERCPDFSLEHMVQLITNNNDIDVEINCYLKDPNTKDIDNLSKIPIDSIFYSGKDEIGHLNKWESKITSLSIKKIKSSQNALEVTIYGM